MNELDFVKEKFREYYANKQIDLPSFPLEREYGFGLDKKIDFRHKGFSSEKELREYFITQTPLYSSFSVAAYEFPQARPMVKKNFKWAQLVFDLDVQVNKAKHVHNELFCETCLEQIRGDSIRLYEDFLLADFGFSKKEISANYSGSKGFHLHVESDAVNQLSGAARRELAFYAQAKGLSADSFFIKEKVSGKKSFVSRGPSNTDLGWAKKYFVYVHNLLSKLGEKELHEMGVKPSVLSVFSENRQKIIEAFEAGNWNFVRGLDKFYQNAWQKMLSEKTVLVDEGVAMDLSRLIRIPGTLHADTGFIAKKCLISDFKLENCLAFVGETKVKALENALVPLDGGFELKKDEVKEVSANSAVLLIRKNKAVLA